MNDITLFPNERIDKVNENLTLIQKKDGLTFGTDAFLLASFIKNTPTKKAAELGSGTGIISLLLAERNKLSNIYAIEIQKDFVDLTKRNTHINDLDSKITTDNADVTSIKASDIDGEVDVVFTNPPYMKTDSGYANRITKKNIARHEVHGSITDFCLAAKRLIRFGGSFFAVYRPDRLTDILYAMREAAIEPKRITLVHADAASIPSMLLIEGKRGGKSGLRMTRPLILYSDASHTEYGADMKYIMENGSFPEDFSVR